MFAEMDKVIKCLALELPESVWNDVDIKYRSLKAKVEKLTSTNTTNAKITKDAVEEELCICGGRLVQCADEIRCEKCDKLHMLL